MVERTLVLPTARRLPAHYAEVLGWWLLSRTIVYGSALVLHLRWRAVGFLGIGVLARPFGVLETWDGRWYTTVADHGYLLVPGQQSDPAFFPLYPLVLRLVHTTGASFMVSGLVLSGLAFPAALLALYELGRRMFPEPLARRAAICAAVFPPGFVFSMVYPQALVLLMIALAGLFAVQGRFGAAALAVAAASLARPEGVFLALPIAAAAASAWSTLDPATRSRAVAAVAAGPVALLTYPLYLSWALHDATAWSTAQRAWGRSFSSIGILQAFYRLPSTFRLHPWFVRDAIAIIIFVALLTAAARAGTPRAWLGSAILLLGVPLMSGSIESEARFGVLALPIYWGLAALGTTPRRDRAIRFASILLLAAGALTIPYTPP